MSETTIHTCPECSCRTLNPYWCSTCIHNHGYAEYSLWLEHQLAKGEERLGMAHDMAKMEFERLNDQIKQLDEQLDRMTRKASIYQAMLEGR